MNDKESLVELIKEGTRLYLDYLDSIDQKGLIDTVGRAKFIADHLLANGVTVPVKCKYNVSNVEKNSLDKQIIQVRIRRI